MQHSRNTFGQRWKNLDKEHATLISAVEVREKGEKNCGQTAALCACALTASNQPLRPPFLPQISWFFSWGFFIFYGLFTLFIVVVMAKNFLLRRFCCCATVFMIFWQFNEWNFIFWIFKNNLKLFNNWKYFFEMSKDFFNHRIRPKFISKFSSTSQKFHKHLRHDENNFPSFFY